LFAQEALLIYEYKSSLKGSTKFSSRSKHCRLCRLCWLCRLCRLCSIHCL